jgi:osmotically-inducible protein OsmY
MQLREGAYGELRHRREQVEPARGPYGGAGESALRGRGPKGYRRSDPRIYEDICEALIDEPNVDCRDIEVTVEGGEVTLSGTVPHRRDKRHVEELAWQIRGVEQVHNRLRTKSLPEGEPWGRPIDAGRRGI